MIQALTGAALWRCCAIAGIVTGRSLSAVKMSHPHAGFLAFNGVSADRIRVENQAPNTHEDAIFAAPMLAGVTGRIVLVTSDSHTFRARRCFAKAGVYVSASPAPDVIKRAGDYSGRLELFVTEMAETASIVNYWYRGRI